MTSTVRCPGYGGYACGVTIPISKKSGLCYYCEHTRDRTRVAQIAQMADSEYDAFVTGLNASNAIAAEQKRRFGQ